MCACVSVPSLHTSVRIRNVLVGGRHLLAGVGIVLGVIIVYSHMTHTHGFPIEELWQLETFVLFLIFFSFDRILVWSWAFPVFYQ